MKEKLVRFLKRILGIHSPNVLNSEKDTWTKAGSAMVDGLIQGITSKTDSAVKSEWYLKKFAEEARNKFCYPMDINEKGENNENK